MIQHVAYLERTFDTPVACVHGIRKLIEENWLVVQLRGGTHGPFLVVCRKDDHS
jgi:hypothetical protein